MSRKKRFHPLFCIGSALVLVSLLSSCSLLSSLLGFTKGDAQSGEQMQTAENISAVIGNMAKNLVSRVHISAIESSTIARAANTAVRNIAVQLAGTEAGDAVAAQLKKYDVLIPVAVGAAVKGLSAFTSADWTDDKRISCVNTVVSLFVSELNGRFAATTRGLPSRALSGDDSAVAVILSNISKAAVSNLGESGISVGSRGSAAGGVVGTMIGSLGDGGISKVLVSDAVGMITKGAVEELKNAGLSESASLATAVQSITKGAVTAISTSKVEGVAAADYSSLATQISKSAASAVGSIVTSDADIKTLAGAVATGAANGIVAVQVASGTGLSATEYRAMIQGITSGTTEGVMTIASVQAAGSGASLIGKITESASYALISNAAVGASQADVFAAVTKGAAAAAQTSIAGGLSETALASAIVLKDSSSATVAAVLKDIQDGIVIGTNQPPLANAGADQSVKVGELVTLDGKASSDTDAGDTLTYTWSISRKPTGSAAALAATGTVATSFTADLAGTYILSLNVSDGKAEADAYCTVVAVTRSTTAYMEARDKTIEDYIKFCDQYLSLAAPDYDAADDCFNKALAAAALVVSDTTTEAKYVARAMTDIGWAYIHHGGRLVGHDTKIVSDAYWRSEADRWLHLVKDSATYYGADSGFATQCDAGLAWLAAATGTTGTVTAD